MTCEHYDEGYDEGFEMGRLEGENHGGFVTLLRLFACEYERAGDWGGAELLRKVAHEAGSRDLKKMVELEEKREAELLSLYKSVVAA